MMRRALASRAARALPRRRTPERGRLCALALLLACGLAAFTGCAPTGGKAGFDAGQAQALWASFAASSADAPQSFSLSASLSIQSPQKSARLLVKFWGNLERPLRLDLSSGMGQTFAMWREDSLGWLAVYPLSSQAFTHKDTKAALGRLGMPIPLNLKELAALSAGRYSTLLPAAFKSVRKTSTGYEYTFGATSVFSSVTLDFEGKPIHIVGKGVEPWSVDLGDFAAAESGRKPLAQRIQLTTPGGLQVVLRVKKLELSPEAMTDSSLELPLPPQARHIPLDRPGDFRAPDLP
ncbi:hypothetical protein [Fundidesulfovibrio terrae]|uniref:hypothetical protein n=1 Tax=Fundidesulfovibrio terrae TaxID=2922866 RepID=UPI001FAE8063|nr:hypothetical protein [Fundidesulfovibrio terrae]